MQLIYTTSRIMEVEFEKKSVFFAFFLIFPAGTVYKPDFYRCF
jgi:hypothetical protein